MKRFYILFLFSFFILSCAKESNVDFIPKNTPDESIKTFSAILSKTVSNELSMRDFIKREALNKFDNDYDVFYPFVKNKMVTEDYSFRQMLLKYTDETTLTKIETQEPLLNILVPSWDWMGAFDVKTWDTSNGEVLVGHSLPDGCNMLYDNGQSLGVIDDMMFPTSPILIVKRSERMRILRLATKAGDNSEYDFADKAFIPQETKVEANTTYRDLPYNPGTNWVPTLSFKASYPEAYSAWKEYGLDRNNYQRQYTSYGMLKRDTLGRLDQNIRESVVAVRLLNMNCMDSSNDPNVHSVTKYDTDYNPFETVVNEIWGGGQFEFRIYATVTNDNGETKVLSDNIIAVDGKDLFDLTKIRHDFYHKTAFTKRKFVCIPNKNDLKPKWYYLPSPLAFNIWDPSKTSSIINVHIFEVDPSEKEQYKETVRIQHGVTVDASVKDWFSFSFNGGASVTEREIEYTIEQESDDLGQKEFWFSDFIITDEKKDSVRLNYYSTGSFDYIIVPQSKVK